MDDNQIVFQCGQESSITEAEFNEMLANGLFFQSWSGCVDVMAEPSDGFYLSTLASITVPTLIINGEKDSANKLTDEFVSASRGKLYIVENASHEAVLSSKFLPETTRIIARFVNHE